MFKPDKIFAAPLAGPGLRRDDGGNACVRPLIFAAPLAGISDKPFRRILRRFAPDACLLTEMISCHSLTGVYKNCPRNFDQYGDEGNIGAQIFGADVALMAEAAKRVADAGAKWVDINMGCPVPKVATKSGAGAYLMRDHALAARMISAVVAAVDIPVSIKTRLGWDDKHKNWMDLGKIAADCGASFMTLHGRTRAQGYTGESSREKIREKREEIGIPIIANGDIKTLDDIAWAESAGYDGAMIGRALLGKPWLLGELSGNNNSQFTIHNSQLVLEHLEMVLEYYGARAGVPLFRKHAAWYSSGMQNSGEFRTRVNQITDAAELKKIITQFLGCVNNI